MKLDDSRPSVTHKFHDRFSSYLDAKRAQDPSAPANIPDLRTRFRVRVVYTDADFADTDERVQYRLVFYVACGADRATAFLNTLGGLFKWCADECFGCSVRGSEGAVLLSGWHRAQRQAGRSRSCEQHD